MNVLLNPGPVTLSSRVREAMQRPDLCHREVEFADLMLDLRARLARVYPGGFLPVLLTGSGTAAVEAMLASLAPRNAPTLVLTNGVYGERMATMLTLQGKPVETLAQSWLSGLDPEGLDAFLARRPDVGHVATVHHETTTGRLNDLAAIAEVCKRHGRQLMIDAVSSFGAEALSLSGPVLAVAATANKCLHGVPGVSFVLVRPDALSEHKSQSPSLYLDLFRYAAEQARGFSPFTMAVQCCYALQEALREFDEEGGAEARRQCYARRTETVRSVLEGLGSEALLPRSESSSMLTAYGLPAIGYAALHDQLKAAGFTIYAGQGELAPRIFRIATMGTIAESELRALTETLARVIG